MDYADRWTRFAKPDASCTSRPICLPHPGKADLREVYNENLNTLILAIGIEGQGGADPRHAFWGPNDTIDQFRKGLDEEGLFTWLSSTFDFEKEDRGVGWESPLLELVLRFEEVVSRILKAPGFKSKVTPICFSAELQGPVEAVERIKREVENAFVFAFLTSLKRETVGLGGVMVLTYRSHKPWIGIRADLEVLSFFAIPFLPSGPNGEKIDIPIEEEWEPYM